GTQRRRSEILMLDCQRRTTKPISFISRVVQIDLGQFPDLMPQRALIIARKDRTAPEKLFRLDRNDFVALIEWAVLLRI
ncbi:MAG: hypothetical protein WCK86_17070, partial [Planctomycetia bacterium]